MWEPSHATLDIGFCFQCGGKGTAPGCAYAVGAQRYQAMGHFYDSFALLSQISVRREALHLFGLREDELLPDLHITRDGVLRIGLGAHQEHRVNHVARATDRNP